MKVIIVGTFDEKTLKKSALIHSLENFINFYFNDKNYGNGIEHIYITFNCVGLGKSYRTGLIVGYVYYKKKKTLEVEVKINVKELVSATIDTFPSIAYLALKEVINYILVHKIKDFNAEKFAEDFMKLVKNIDLKNEFKAEFVYKLESNVSKEEFTKTKVKRFKNMEELILYLEKNINKNHFPKGFWINSPFIMSSKKQINILNKSVDVFIEEYITQLKQNKTIEIISDVMSEYIEKVEVFELDTVEIEILTEKMCDFVDLLKTIASPDCPRSA